MKVVIFCDNKFHPVKRYLESYVASKSSSVEIKIVNAINSIDTGTLLILVSCSQKIDQSIISKFKKTLVIHASALPLNRGWSPHVWEIIEGSDRVTVSLLEANEKIDTGDLWHQITLSIPKHFLYDEINQVLFDTELKLIDWAIENYKTVVPRQQDKNIIPTYRRMRTPKDSEIDIQKSFGEQFDLIRVCDPDRYPAFVKLHGYKYQITIQKIEE